MERPNGADALHPERPDEAGRESTWFSDDGSRVLAVAKDYSVHVWDAKTGAHLAVVPLQPADASAGFNGDGTMVFTHAASDSTLRFWDAATGGALLNIVGTKATNLAFPPNGNLFAAVVGNDVSVFDGGTVLANLRGHAGPVDGASFSADGSRILTSSTQDGTVRLWDARSGKPLSVLRYHNGATQAEFFNRNDRLIVSAGFTVQVLDVGSLPSCEPSIVDVAVPPPPDPLGDRVRAMRYVSSSGDSVALTRANALRDPGERLGDNAALVPARGIVDRARGLIDVCFFPPATSQVHSPGCEFHVNVRTADIGIPPGTPKGTVDDPTIGMTLHQLLDYLRSNPALKAKTLHKGPKGDVVLVDAYETDDAGCQSGQCEVLSPTTTSLYFLADGVVVARAYRTRQLS